MDPESESVIVSNTHPTLCTRSEIECILKFRIRNLQLYQEALLHKSAVKHYDVRLSNERLEFIGDSVLNLIIAQWIYESYPYENEGFMTKLRTRIVSGPCLTTLAKYLQLNQYLRMNEKALKQGWNNNARILEDTVESIIGAIFLDLGLDKARDFIVNDLLQQLDLTDMLRDTNYKDKLMRFTQTNQFELPEYIVLCEKGPNHDKRFVIAVRVQQYTVGEGVAKNKKQAEQQAAQHALICMGISVH